MFSEMLETRTKKRILFFSFFFFIKYWCRMLVVMDAKRKRGDAEGNHVVLLDFSWSAECFSV
jgi:hypothetical protein